MKPIKVIFVSNFSKAVTGFGKNMKNVLQRLHVDPRFEVVEVANGTRFGADLGTPWKSYGSYPSNPSLVQKLQADAHQNRLAEYGNSTIDAIIQEEKPDIVVGIEDIWAFDWVKKVWFDKLKTVIWTTLDSLPILDLAYQVAPKVDKFLVWASFAENEMKKKGIDVETLHGAIDFSSFYPLPKFGRDALREKHGVQDNFVVGFVFKNQLRKSVPNLLDGFKLFKKENPKAKLLLHTDWVVNNSTWDIPRFIREKDVNPKDVLATYICESCKRYKLSPYLGEGLPCDHCKEEKLVTKSSMFGVTDHELNEIYNMMDVYCHPFTSGGQELPVQEAKAAGLITLVTEYSCGTDSCYPEQGGLPLAWVGYEEPFTQFIKSTTLPESICEQLQVVADLTPEAKDELVAAGLTCVKESFCVDKIVGRLKDILLDLGKTDWDFDFEEKRSIESFRPDESLPDDEWAISLYKGMFHKTFGNDHVEIVDAVGLIRSDGRDKVLAYLQNVALQKNQRLDANNTKFEDLLDKKKKDRIAIVAPESAGDLLIINSLLTNLKTLYPDKDIYIITNPQYFAMIDSHPAVYKMLPYKPELESLLLLEGQGPHEGYFEIAFLPFIGTQRHLNYLHNAKDKNEFDLP